MTGGATCGALIIAAGLLAAAASTARADEGGRTRAVHWSIGVGGYVAVTGPSRAGPAVEVEVYPGVDAGLDPRSERFYGLARRLPQLGVGLYLRGLDRELSSDGGGSGGGGEEPGDRRAAVTVGICYEVGAARPAFALSLRVEAGLVLARAPVRVDVPATGGGVHVTVGLIGPVAAGVSAGGLLIYDGVDTSLALSGAFTLGLAR